jgi:hypothetical protein
MTNRFLKVVLLVQNRGGPIQETLTTLRPRKSIHCFVHWLPNKRFVWLQSCEFFINMAPGCSSGQGCLQSYSSPEEGQVVQVGTAAKSHTVVQKRARLFKWAQRFRVLQQSRRGSGCSSGHSSLQSYSCSSGHSSQQSYSSPEQGWSKQHLCYLRITCTFASHSFTSLVDGLNSKISGNAILNNPGQVGRMWSCQQARGGRLGLYMNVYTVTN